MRNLCRSPIGLAAIALAVGTTAIASAQKRESGVTWETVLDNDTMKVTRAHMAPGSAGNIDMFTASSLVVQVTPGDVEITQLGENSRAARDAGAVTFVPAGVGYRIVNIGKTTFDVLVVEIKPTRAPAPAAPPTEAPPGITRTTLVDNADTRVVRVRFAPTGREPVPTHPNDLLTVQITVGTVEILNGPDRSTAAREPGFVQFVSRNVAHAFASADTQAFEILSVAIK